MKTHTKSSVNCETLIGWLLVMPSLIFMAAFTVWPPVFREHLAQPLQKYKLGMSAPEFIGLKTISVWPDLLFSGK